MRHVPNPVPACAKPLIFRLPQFQNAAIVKVLAIP
jgi:hypothetical protein